MILVDTSIWIDHLRASDAVLANLLRGRRVILHPFVLGEIALGNPPDRPRLLQNLSRLPEAPVATPDELFILIETGRLFGTGIGWVDAHLLASVRLVKGSTLWTRDSKLLSVARRLEVAMQPN